ncbi:histidine kinase N-terminal 7TM domain-containing protein [Halorhabdus salina]|uniref:histidine kinase N-terminal 7TM domain-containing protein n=1 Tax=Halorhabdus salina TaxID=2750670 RepID=UPI0015EE95B3|nr:histidine kinase N-terminal 7TM domain-containing protein [Halorhabdus salina]
MEAALQPVALASSIGQGETWMTFYPLVLFVTGVLTAILAAIGHRFRSAPGSNWFTATMVLSTVWTAGTLVVVFSDELTTLLITEIILIGCSLTTPVTWLLFVVSYIGFERLITWKRLGVLFALPAAAIVAMAAAPVTDLYFADITEVITAEGISILNTRPGPLAYVMLLYVFVVIVVGLGLISWTVFTHKTLFSGQALWLLVGSLPPFVMAMLEPVGIIDEQHLPLTPIGFGLMGLAYGYGLFHHRLFDLSPGTWRIGAETTFDGLSESIVIVDQHGDVLGCNRSACDRFGWEKAEAFGRDIAELDSRLAEARHSDRPFEFADDNHQYEVSVSEITDMWGRAIGDALVVREVTERYEQRQQLEVLNRVLRHNLRNDTMVVASRGRELADRYDDPLAETIVETAEGLLNMAEKARTIENRLGRETSTPERDRRLLAA